MNPGIKLRLAIFITAVALLLVLIGWTAYSSWGQIGELHERLTAMQWKSFQTSDYLQQTDSGHEHPGPALRGLSRAR